MDTQNQSSVDALCDAALSLAAHEPWQDISLWALCRTAKVSLSACAAASLSKASIAEALNAQLDQAMLGEADIVDHDALVRDRLFEVLMARFDAMEENRAAWMSILKAENYDLAATLIRVGARSKTSRWALEAAGVSADGLIGLARVAGLTRILRQTDAVWRLDSGDLSRTMAQLDQALRKAEANVLRIQGFTRGFVQRGQNMDDHNDYNDQAPKSAAESSL